MSAEFKFTETDLDRPLVDVLGGLELTIESFGVSHDEYIKVETIDYNMNEYSTKLDGDSFPRHGIDTLETFMDYYCRSHIWNNYKYSLRHDLKDRGKYTTLRDFMMFYYKKAKRFHSNDDIPYPPSNGDILEYLKTWDPEWLVTVGW
jgi:hypothetical protein